MINPPKESQGVSIPIPSTIRMPGLTGILKTIVQLLVTIVDKLNRNVAFGSLSAGERLGNHDAQVFLVVTPAVANTEFEIWHGLGRAPRGYWVLWADKDVPQPTASRPACWTSEVFYLKSSVANANITLAAF
jgi:hypothetical protein